MLTAPDSKSRPRSRFASRQAAPVPALAGAVGRVSALADDALVTPLLGYAQQRLAVFERFGQRDGGATEAFQEDLQAGLALHQRLRTEIAAVERK